jgi:hypothetical protein
MTPEESKKQRAQRFISGSSRSRFGFGSRKSIQTRIPGIIPKRSIPSAVITSKSKSPDVTSEVDSADSETTFGRLLLNFVQINNDLDAISEKITRKEVGNDKKSVVETIKPFVSNFFSGAGGAIRSLALWKMLMGVLNGDVSSIFKGLFGIGLSFLPKIGMMIAGSILKNMAASMLGRSAGAGLARGFGGGGGRVARSASPKMGIGKWAGIASLGAGALALGSAFSSNQSKDIQSQQIQQESETQKRLEELTAQQKDQGNIGAIAQEDLKKFESLNKKFEAAIDLLLMKPQRNNTGTSGGGADSSSAAATNFPPGDTSGDLSGSENAQKAFNYFLSRGYSKEQSSALVGNFLQENSALDPTVANSIGHKGIMQWDPNIRYPQLVQFAKSKGLNPDSIEAQLQFAEHELMTGSGGLSKSTLQKTKSLEEATLLVRKQLLRPGEHEANDANRLRQAQNTLNRYGASTPNQGMNSGGIAPSPPRRSPQQVSSNIEKTSPRVSFNIAPFPTKKDPGSLASTGGEVPNIDPSNPRNAYAFLTQGELNLV